MRARFRKIAITILLSLFLAFFTIGPVITLVLTSFDSSHGGLFGGPLILTASSYFFVFSNSYTMKAFYDTLELGVGTSALSLIIALPISYGLSWSNMPLKRFIRTTQMMGLGLPGFIVSLVMIVFTGSIYRTGFHVHSVLGVLLAMSISSVPFQVLYSTLSLERLDYRLIEAARVNGLGTFRTFFKITMPLLSPGIMSGFMVVFLLTTGSLSVPLLLAPPSFPVLAPLAYSELLSFFNWSVASADLTLIFGINIVAVIIYTFFSRRIPRTVSGKGFRVRRNGNPVVRYGLAAYSLLVSFIFLGEIFILVGYAFGKKWAGTPLPQGFTTNYFSSAISLYPFSPISTVIISSAAAVAAVLISLIISYGNRTGSVGAPVLLNFLVLTVFSLSNTIIGISYLSLFSNRQTGFLINSIPLVLLFGYIFARLGYASNSVRISVESVSESIVHSARLMVPKNRNGFARIILPLVIPGLLEGFLLVFVRSSIDYASTVFLAPVNWTTLTLASYSFIITGELGQGAALSLAVLAITMPLSYLLYRLRTKSSM
ncbi:MAG: ABC transporter permease [Cuniculiplasma sp.]